MTFASISGLTDDTVETGGRCTSSERMVVEMEKEEIA